MKMWLCLILLLASGCSFKKNPHTVNQAQPQAKLSDSDQFLQKIRNDDENLVVKYISEEKPRSLSDKSQAGALLRSALVRGSVKIVRALLIAGVSPYTELATYRGDSSFDRNAFALVTKFNAKIANQIDASLYADNFDSLQQLATTYSLSCETIVDLVQEYRTSLFSIINLDSNLIKFLGKIPSCSRLNQSSLKNEWLIKDIFRLYTEKDRFDHPEFFWYLSHLFEPGEFNFESGLIIPTKGISPVALIMYKIKQVTSPELKNQLIATWAQTVESISMPKPNEGVTFFDESFHIGFVKVDDSEAIDQYFKFNVVNLISNPLLATRPNCFVLCNNAATPTLFDQFK